MMKVLILAALSLAAWPCFPCTEGAAERVSKFAPVGQCELYEFVSWPTWNPYCPGTANYCITITLTGQLAGSNGTCPTTSCTGAAYAFTVTYNGCGGATSCCTGDVSVECTGYDDPALLSLGESVDLTIGPARPGCGKSARQVLKISCWGGSTLVERHIDTICDTCD